MLDVLMGVTAFSFSCLFVMNAKLLQSIDSSEMPSGSTIMKNALLKTEIVLAYFFVFRNIKEFLLLAGRVGNSIFLLKLVALISDIDSHDVSRFLRELFRYHTVYVQYKGI